MKWSRFDSCAAIDNNRCTSVVQCLPQQTSLTEILGYYSLNERARRSRTPENAIVTNRPAEMMRKVKLIGLVMNIVALPSDTIIARRKFSSSIGANTNPSSIGVGSHSNFLIT